jgi:hypothetical protein
MGGGWSGRQMSLAPAPTESLDEGHAIDHTASGKLDGNALVAQGGTLGGDDLEIGGHAAPVTVV